MTEQRSSAVNADADKAMTEIWSEWFSFYERHFRASHVKISMADQQAFYEIAQPILRRLASSIPAQPMPGCDAPQLDRVFIGKGEYVSAEQATKTIMDLQRNLRHWREECGKLHAKLATALPSPDISSPEA